MSRNRFVLPETVRVDLSDGDWIEIKRELSVGDAKKIEGSALRSVQGQGDEIGVEWRRYYLTRVETWLVDWSFTDASGQRVPVSVDAIAALDTLTAAEIDAAITAQSEAAPGKSVPPTTNPSSSATPSGASEPAQS